MKWVLLGIGILILAIIVLLFIPVRYYFTFEKWKAFFHVDILFGLWKKEIHIPGKTKETEPPAASRQLPAASSQEPESGESPSVPPRSGGKVVAPATKGGRQPDGDSQSAGVEETEWTADSGERPVDKPSLFSQVRFAIGNGFMGRVFHGAWKLLVHSFPGHWEVTGTFGTGDPMDTAMVQGLFCAFLPGVADGVVWKYIDTENTLKGKGRGRIIPLYVLYIALTVLLSREAREFWRFRKGTYSQNQEVK